MAISDFLTPEQANLLLDQQFSNPQGIARLNPLAFQYENAFTPYSERQMNALKVMRLPSKLYDSSYSDPAFFSDTLSGYSYDPYLGTKENNFNYLYGTRPAFKYETMPETDPSRFTGVNLESGYLDRAGSYDQDVYAEQEKQKGGGIGGLFRFLLGLAVPGAGLLMNLPKRGLEGIRSLNQRIQNTDFGQSKTLQEFLQKREARKDAERLQTVGQQLQQASERGGGYQPTTEKQNIARTESRVRDGKTRAYGL
jgi:hypothetical protein